MTYAHDDGGTCRKYVVDAVGDLPVIMMERDSYDADAGAPDVYSIPPSEKDLFFCQLFPEPETPVLRTTITPSPESRNLSTCP